MRRILAVVLLLVLLPAVVFAAEKTKVDRYEVTYETAESSCTILSVSDPLRGYGGALPMELPAELDGYTVTVLGAGALAEHSTVGSLTLPASLKRMESSACKGAWKLSSVVVPGTIEYIADDAFDGCAAGLTLYGPADCYAQKWAEAKGIPFFANDQAVTDFRSFHWGDTMEEVIAVEGEPGSRDVSDLYAASSIRYDVEWMGKHNDLIFYFSDTEGLYAAQYITADLSTVSDAYDYVEDVLAQISQKYGLAVLPRERRTAEAMNMRDAQAVLTGNLEFGADLETNRSQINVWLTGGDDFAYIYVYYCSLDIIPQPRDYSGSF